MTKEDVKKELQKYLVNIQELLESTDCLDEFEVDNDGQIVLYTSIFKNDDGSYRIDY